MDITTEFLVEPVLLSDTITKIAVSAYRLVVSRRLDNQANVAPLNQFPNRKESF